MTSDVKGKLNFVCDDTTTNLIEIIFMKNKRERKRERERDRQRIIWMERERERQRIIWME